MKIKHLLILLILFGASYFSVFSFFEKKEVESIPIKVSKGSSPYKIKTPDELWEEQQKQQTSISKTQTANTLVPQHLLEMEAKARDQVFSQFDMVDEIELASIEPDGRNIEEYPELLPSTEPEIEVLPLELTELEASFDISKKSLESIIPTTETFNDKPTTDELPSEPAEFDALPEELLILENILMY